MWKGRCSKPSLRFLLAGFAVVGSIVVAGIPLWATAVNDDDAYYLSRIVQHPHKRVCLEKFGEAACFARVQLDDVTGEPLVTSSPQGYNPADLRAAYGPPVSDTSTRTIAIVDAYDDPNAEADLGVYRAQFGLPSCTTANGCFKKVNQNGQASPLPPGDVNWSQEISLDLQVASAMCPSCKILLVEANTANLSDLGTAVNTAVSLGAAAVSNSYGTNGEFSGETNYDAYYNHAGALITASSGDATYGVIYPAASPYVLAVGGTSLVTSTNSRGWAESVWPGTGSGCSQYETKPVWQTDTGCSLRTVGDVSAVADPNTGVSVYDSYGVTPGWYVFGGTSVSSPIVAATFTGAGAPVTPAFPYSYPSDFYDVTTGSNGTCTPAYLCTGMVGYDGPTGWGTPNQSAMASNMCQPTTCSAQHATCGTISDGCGGNLNCGTCGVGQTCLPDHTCGCGTCSGFGVKCLDGSGGWYWSGMCCTNNRCRACPC